MNKQTMPNLFFVGGMKCASTSLYKYLIQHPQVFGAYRKEPGFFCYKYRPIPERNINNINDIPEYCSDISSYLALYENRKQEKYCCDASAAYLYYFLAANDIRSFCQDAKIIISLRNPIDRAYSGYLYQKNDFMEYISFEEALDAEDFRIQNSYGAVYHYKKLGCYYKQVQHYLDVFDQRNVHIVLYDDIVENIDDVMKQICLFLEIDPIPFDTKTKHTTSGVLKPGVGTSIFKIIENFRTSQLYTRYKAKVIPDKIRAKIHYNLLMWNRNNNLEKATPMKPETREYLREYFAEDIKKTSVLIGRDLSHWK